MGDEIVVQHAVGVGDGLYPLVHERMRLLVAGVVAAAPDGVAVHRPPRAEPHPPGAVEKHVRVHALQQLQHGDVGVDVGLETVLVAGQMAVARAVAAEGVEIDLQVRQAVLLHLPREHFAELHVVPGTDRQRCEPAGSVS